MLRNSHFSRRGVIRQFAFGIATSFFAGASLQHRILAASVPTLPSTGRLSLSIWEFEVLQQEQGSLRLEVGLDTPILVNHSGGQYYAMSAKCKHNGCTVPTFNTDLGVIRCPCHGSQYNIDGSLNQGPALEGLDRFTAIFDGNETVTVTLPGVTFGAREITVVSVQGNTRRLKLTFQARIFTTYGVVYQPTLGAPAQTAPFSLTPGGAATQTTYRNTVFNANDPLPKVDLYVDAPGNKGFFSITMEPAPV